MDLAVFFFDIDGFTSKLSQGSLMDWESRFHDLLEPQNIRHILHARTTYDVNIFCIKIIITNFLFDQDRLFARTLYSDAIAFLYCSWKG